MNSFSLSSTEFALTYSTKSIPSTMWAPIWDVSIKSYSTIVTVNRCRNCLTSSMWHQKKRYRWWVSVRHVNRSMLPQIIASSKSIWRCAIDVMTIASVVCVIPIAAGTRRRIPAAHTNWICCRWAASKHAYKFSGCVCAFENCLWQQLNVQVNATGARVNQRCWCRATGC